MVIGKPAAEVPVPGAIISVIVGIKGMPESLYGLLPPNAPACKLPPVPKLDDNAGEISGSR